THDGGGGQCAAPGTCAPGYHDGGAGACVADGQCSAGYQLFGASCGVSACNGTQVNAACGPDGAPGSCTAPALSCGTLHAAEPSLPSGPYWLKPAGLGSPLQVFCDMDSDGGGWTLVGNLI